MSCHQRWMFMIPLVMAPLIKSQNEKKKKNRMTFFHRRRNRQAATTTLVLQVKNAVDVRNMVRGRDDKINQLKKVFFFFLVPPSCINTFLKRFQVSLFLSILFLAFAFVSSQNLRLSRFCFSGPHSFASCTASLTSSWSRIGMECRIVYV